MISKRDSRCFVPALAPDASALTRLLCLAYANVPLWNYCKIRYISKITAASRGSPYHSTAFLFFLSVLIHLQKVAYTHETLGRLKPNQMTVAC